MSIKPRLLAVLGLFPVIAHTGVHAQDTSLTKRQVAAHAEAANAAIAREGISALLGSATPATVLQFPGLALGRARGELRREIGSRYTGATMRLTVQHILVSHDGLLGCAIGLTRVLLPHDTISSWRYGRYASCWHRPSRAAAWTLRVHAQGGERPGGATPDSLLEGAPHSAARGGDGNDARAALAADESFAKTSVDLGAGLAFARFAAVDGTLLGERPRPLRGPGEIARAFGPKVEGSSVSWHPLLDLAAGSGGLALTMGEAVHRDGGEENRTKYLSIWRLEEDGTWRYVIDLGSARP